MPQNVERLMPVLRGQPVIPVIRIERAADAVPLAKALVAGGLPAIEITLRTPEALDAIRAASSVEGAIVGAGTVLDPAQFEAAAMAGATFIVSPGLTPALVGVADGHDVPLLPGAVTPGEIMNARDTGYSMLKFFPAEQAGGAAYLKALSAPLAGVSFCPTGGIGLANAANYLSLPNVVCVGGSWVAPDEAVEAGDWTTITRLAREASQLGR